MRQAQYQFRAKSGAWTTHPDAHSPDYRLLRFDMTVERDGKRHGGNNIHAVIGAPDQPQRGLDEGVCCWLTSGWWVSLRNQFAAAPDAAAAILSSAANALSALTAEATDARGADAEVVTQRVFSAAFTAAGPDYW
ncbi:MAG: hypothetical protein ACRDPM_01285 [Solirubrobacteraceae bacterium]